MRLSRRLVTLKSGIVIAQGLEPCKVPGPLDVSSASPRDRTRGPVAGTALIFAFIHPEQGRVFLGPSRRPE